LIGAEKRFPFKPLQAIPGDPGIEFENFVGSKACKECHTEQYDIWEKSTHGLAGGPPEKNFITKFAGTTLKFKDAVVKFSINKKNEYLVTVKPDAEEKKVFKVTGLVGGGHMVGGGTQGLFTPLPDGTVRFLPFDYIKKEDLWFVQVRKKAQWTPINEKLSLYECSDWPPSRVLGQNENFTHCSQCHGSQIQTSFDPVSRKYITRYKSLSINCESCHGPGKRHIELAKSENIESLKDIGINKLAIEGKDGSLNICFQCHADSAHFTDNRYLPGANFNNHISLKLASFFGVGYHPDGRVKIFGYQKNHLYSDCYISGSMTCVDCHAPHSQAYRDIWGKELIGRFDDKQCLDCHMSKKNEIEKHSHHKLDSEGSKCTACHMPFLQHKGVGKLLRFARSDHTIPIPRPLFDSSIGIENACLKCHKDLEIAKLQEITDEWYGKVKPHKPIIKALINADKLQNRKEAAEQLLDDSYFHAMAQVSGLILFLKKFALPNMDKLEIEIVEKLKKLCSSPDLDLQALALASLHLMRGHDPEIHKFLCEQAKKLGKREIPIKIRWGTVFNLICGKFMEQEDYKKAVIVLKKALDIYPGQHLLWTNLGIAMAALRKPEQAIEYFLKGIEIQPNNFKLHMFRADLLIEAKQHGRALNHLRHALALHPEFKELKDLIENIMQDEENR
ncbi:tetratricopeptide repeat protein, partial [Candidatus Riflebacteria bacterium]